MKMYRQILIFVLIISLMPFWSTAAPNSITGVVKSEGKPISHVTVSIPVLGIATSTDSTGIYWFSDVAASMVEMKVSCIGYQPIVKKVIIGKLVPIVINFDLTTSLENFNEVVVSGVAKSTRISETPFTISSISAGVIEQSAETNLIDVLSKNTTGLSVLKTGPNISKPFIRGLGYNRVLTLYDGLRQEGQQWGDEHGIEVDAYSIAKAEVIKGPSSLMYGSDAVAGVVTLTPYIPTQNKHRISGSLISEYQSNNGLIGIGLRVGACYKHLLWAARGSIRKAQNYSNPIDGRVYNTGFEERNISLLAGYIDRHSKTYFNATLYDNLQGIPDGSRDSISRNFTKQIFEGLADDILQRPMVTRQELHSYNLSPLHQHIQHYRCYTQHQHTLHKGDVAVLLGFQQSVRREFTHPQFPNLSGLYIRLNTLNYTFRYNLPNIRGVELSIGTNGMYQHSKNLCATDFPIPDYQLQEAGMYILSKWKHKKWTVSGGVRYDLRYLSSDDLFTRVNLATGFLEQVLSNADSAKYQFKALSKLYSGISFSVGFTYLITPHINLKVNVARGYRAPSITEVASNGLDPGAHILYLGNSSFKPEFSLEEDIGLFANFIGVSASVSLYNNNLENYIYLEQSLDSLGALGEIGQGNKVYQYKQSQAQLFGAEASIDIHPAILKGLSIAGNMSLVYGLNRSPKYRGKGINGEYLPLIQPLLIQTKLMQIIATSFRYIPTITVHADAEYYDAQTHFLALNNTETASRSYTIFNTGLVVDCNYYRDYSFKILFQINNIFNISFQSNLSRLKYLEYYAKSSNGAKGIYNMGRNISLKIIIPF